ncbi:MAG: hypothetical protein QM775_23170 [Pirellulales bacterium]
MKIAVRSVQLYKSRYPCRRHRFFPCNFTSFADIAMTSIPAKLLACAALSTLLGCTKNTPADGNFGPHPGLFPVVAVAVGTGGQSPAWFEAPAVYSDAKETYLCLEPAIVSDQMRVVFPKAKYVAYVRSEDGAKAVPAKFVSVTFEDRPRVIISAPADQLPVPLKPVHGVLISRNEAVEIVGIPKYRGASDAKFEIARGDGWVDSWGTTGSSSPALLDAFYVESKELLNVDSVLVYRKTDQQLIGIGQVSDKSAKRFGVRSMNVVGRWGGPYVCRSYSMIGTDDKEGVVEFGALIHDPLNSHQSIGATCEPEVVSTLLISPQLHSKAKDFQRSTTLPANLHVPLGVDRRQCAFWSGLFVRPIAGPQPVRCRLEYLNSGKPSVVQRVELKEAFNFRWEAGRSHDFPQAYAYAPLAPHPRGGIKAADASFQVDEVPLAGRAHEQIPPNEPPLKLFGAGKADPTKPTVTKEFRFEENPRYRYKRLELPVACASFDGRFIYLSDTSRVLYCVDVEENRVVASVMLPKTCRQLQFSSDRLIATAGQGADSHIWLLDPKSLAILYEIPSPFLGEVATAPKYPFGFAYNTLHFFVFELQTGVVKLRVPKSTMFRAIYQQLPRDLVELHSGEKNSLIASDNGKVFIRPILGASIDSDLMPVNWCLRNRGRKPGISTVIWQSHLEHVSLFLVRAESPTRFRYSTETTLRRLNLKSVRQMNLMPVVLLRWMVPRPCVSILTTTVFT